MLLSASTAAAITASPKLGVLILAVVFILASVAQFGGYATTYAILLLLGAWSYGANNISIAGITAVEPLLLLCAYATRASWANTTTRGHSVAIFWTGWASLIVVAVFRLIVDVPRFGMTALRDALYVLDIVAVLPGVGLGMLLIADSRRAWRSLDLAMWIGLIWYSLYPLRDRIEPLGPTVGVQHPVSLFSFTFSGIFGASALFYFLWRRGRSSLWGVGLSLAVIVATQQKGIYLSVPLALLVLWANSSRNDRSLQAESLSPTGGRSGARYGRLALWLIPAVVVLSIGVPTGGRLGSISLATIVSQLQGLSGDSESIGGGSVEARAGWIPLVQQAVRQAPAGEIIGSGFGTDLLGGFRGSNGSLVRKPHNDYLEAYGRTGVLGLVSLLLVMAATLRWGWQAAHRHRLGAWILGTQIVMLFVAGTQPLFAFAYGGIVYYALSGIALALSKRSFGDEAPRYSRVPQGRRDLT